MNKIILDIENCSIEEYRDVLLCLDKSSIGFTKLTTNGTNLSELKNCFDNIIELAEELIHKLPEKGLKCSDCQRMCLQNSILEFSYLVNGIEESDLLE